MKKLKFSRFLIRRMVPVMTAVVVICVLSSTFCSYVVNNNVQKYIDNLFHSYQLQLISLNNYYQNSFDAFYDSTDYYSNEKNLEFEYPDVKDLHVVFAVTNTPYTEIFSASAPNSNEEVSESSYLLSLLEDDLLSYGMSKENLDAHFNNTVSTYTTDNRILRSTYYFSLDENAYLFNCVYSYDFSKTSSYAVQIIWAAGLLIGIAFSVILSVVSYNKYLTQYEIDNYRRSMTSALAHDLKTPLTAIMGYSENLKSNIHSEKREYYADAVIENVRYMNEIIMSTLELAKIEEQDTKLNKTDIDMILVANELLAKYKAEFDDRGITVSVSGKCIVKADRELISRAVENLISNAEKYTVDGGKIEITADEKQFIVCNSCDEKLIGETDDFCKAFGKADESRSNRKGSGMGLAIVKNIAQLHKFRLKADASGGKFTARIIFK